MKIFSKKLKAIFLLIGMVAFTVPTFAITANAGADQELNVTATNSTVTLNGTASTADNNGTIVKYEWFYNGASVGVGATLDVESVPLGTYSVTLRVTDNLGNTASDTVNVKVLLALPLTANAGTDINVTLTPSNSTVTLDGTSSTAGSNGTIVQYEWFYNGESVGTGATLAVEAPTSGTYVVSLTVTDSLGNTASDTVNVEVLLNGSTTVLTKDEPLVPENCLGHITKSGVDSNGNGVLDEDEVNSTVEYYDEGTPVTREALMIMIENGDDVTQVNTCKITDMSNLFNGGFDNSPYGELGLGAGSLIVENFNQDISGWNTGSVTNMNYMFATTIAFNQDISSWDVSNVTDMSMMFFKSKAFNQPLDNWDVFNVTSMSGMFYEAQVFNQPLDNWDVSNVTRMDMMFGGISPVVFNQPLTSWDVSNVTNMNSMFLNAQAFNQDISNWDISNVGYHEYFALNSALENAYNPFYEEVGDTTKPVITLLGDANITLTVGNTYTDAGAMATDDVDGNITANMQTTSDVNTSAEGNYTVTYSVSDLAGNMADVVTRRVYVLNPQYTRDDITEIVTDHITKLQWQDNEEAQTVEKTWYGAKNYCSNLSLGGYSDWYLPPREELRTIGDTTHGSTTYGTPSINSIFQNIFVSNWRPSFYWSSSFYGHDDPSYQWEEAWVVLFTLSNDEVRQAIPASSNVRCVRKGE